MAMDKKYYSVGLITWVARLSTIAFALFLSIFAMDVFNEELGFGNSLIALFMHLIPSLLILLILLFSWRWEWIGGIGYMLLGFVYLFLSKNRFDWISIVLISVPLFSLGILFWIGWFQRKKTDSY